MIEFEIGDEVIWTLRLFYSPWLITTRATVVSPEGGGCPAGGVEGRPEPRVCILPENSPEPQWVARRELNLLREEKG